MIKFTLIFTFLTLILSCSNNQNYEKEIIRLKLQNDSLTNILKEYDNKFVFDKMVVAHFPSKDNDYKIGSKYKGDFLYVPFNKDDSVIFETEYLENGTKTKKIDTLQINKGYPPTYKFEFDIKSKTNAIHFRPQINNPLSKKHFNRIHHNKVISDKIVAK